MTTYQLGYAAGRPQMYDPESRKKKAYRMIKTLEDFLGSNKLQKLSVLDIGSSAGIIDNCLAEKFSSVVGIDIDRDAITFARKAFHRKNLKFQVGDALNLDFKDCSFDVVVCAHIYEHVANPRKLLSEIYRVLKSGGVCYFAAVNKLWPLEHHYNLLFLSWIPKKWANFYMRMANKGDVYYETPLSFWGLKKMVRRFLIREYTQRIWRDPAKFGYGDTIPFPINVITWALSPLSKVFSPTFFWLLVKP